MRGIAFIAGCLCLLAAGLVGISFVDEPQETPPVAPVAPVCPPDGPCPQPAPRKPWGPGGASVGAVKKGTVVSPDGKVTVQVDLLPPALRIENTVGTDDRGMCVMSSIEMAGLWANVPGVKGLRDWCAKEPGGAWPSKVDDQLKRYYASKGMPVPPYLSVSGITDPSTLEAVLASGRYVAGKYGSDHMLNWLAWNEGGWCAAFDNNEIRDDRIKWLPVKEAERKWAAGQMKGWVFAWLAPGAPPIPMLE